MGRCRIEELSLVQLLIAYALIKQMVPDEPIASEGLPDEDPLLHGGVYAELHASGYDDGFSLSFHHSPLPVPSGFPMVPL